MSRYVSRFLLDLQSLSFLVHVARLGCALQAQAQECIVEKSLVDGRSPNAVAKLALQAALQYEELFGMLEGHALVVYPGAVPSASGMPNVATASLLAEVLSSRFASAARNRFEAKAHYLRALAYYYSG